jgi:hypothetical protein
VLQWWRVSLLREIAEPFVVAPPTGVRVRTRLRVSGVDAAVLRQVGEYLGSLASADLAARCAEGRLDAGQRARSRRVRKQELTAKSSSRWAGALTRTSGDAYQLAYRNLLAERRCLLARIKRIEARRAVAAGQRAGRVRGYATAAERHAKTIRVQTLRARLANVERQLESGRISVCRGGKKLLRKRNSLAAAGLTETKWRERWEASRMFLTGWGEGQGLGQRDDPLEPRPELAGDQAPYPAGASGEPAERALPAVVPGRVHLPGRRCRRPGRDRGRAL